MFAGLIATITETITGRGKNVGSDPFRGIYDIGDGGRIEWAASCTGGSALWSTLGSPLIGYTGRFMCASFELPVLSAAVTGPSNALRLFNYFFSSPAAVHCVQKFLNIKIHCTEGRNHHTYIFRPARLSSAATLAGRTAAAGGPRYGAEAARRGVLSCRHCQHLCRCVGPRG